VGGASLFLLFFSFLGEDEERERPPPLPLLRKGMRRRSEPCQEKTRKGGSPQGVVAFCKDAHRHALLSLATTSSVPPSLHPSLPTQRVVLPCRSAAFVCGSSQPSRLSPSSTHSPLPFYFHSILAQVTGSVRVPPMPASPSRWSGSDACVSSAASSASTATRRRSTSTSTTTYTCGTCCLTHTLPTRLPRSLHSHGRCLWFETYIMHLSSTSDPLPLPPSPPRSPCSCQREGQSV